MVYFACHCAIFLNITRTNQVVIMQQCCTYPNLPLSSPLKVISQAGNLRLVFESEPGKSLSHISPFPLLLYSDLLDLLNMKKINVSSQSLSTSSSHPFTHRFFSSLLYNINPRLQLGGCLCPFLTKWRKWQSCKTNPDFLWEVNRR